jgi:hypothetical protein
MLLFAGRAGSLRRTSLGKPMDQTDKKKLDVSLLEGPALAIASVNLKALARTK